ncbi:MAG TPA: sulfite exporter TauE/SafE family protein [Acidimicrobiales bacterium]
MAGLAIGLLYGVFGVGSAFATPVLAMLGVPGMAAVVGPLPALLPSSTAGAWSYSRRGKVDWPVARRTLVTGFPAAVAGALASRWVGGPVLLVLSGVVLLVVGLRVLRPTRLTDGEAEAEADAARRRASAGFVMTAAALVGFASGLLANGGGFLLVPMFLLALGLDMNEAAGTSMVVAAVLTVPTLFVHTLIGDVNWLVAGGFGLGLVPGTLLGGRLAVHLPAARLRSAFGVLLVVFAVWFLARQVLPLVV